ncbi:MAG: hypothetical protein AB7P07_07030 [Hyphomonadaceae bacterium]
MIRALVALALLALAAACQRQEAATTCDVQVEHPLFFSHPEAADIVTARMIGPSCDRAVALLSISTEDGHPIWSWTAPASRAFGDAFHGADAEEMHGFLERWAAPAVVTTAGAPAWPLPDTARTTLDQITYDDIRARSLPMLCHLSGVAIETCVFWEPAAGGAGLFFERDVTQTQRSPHDTD